MITNLGKIITLNNLAQGERSLVSHIAVGGLATVATVTDKIMANEWARTDVRFIVADPINNRLFIKAVLPTQFEGKIYEIGAYVTAGYVIDNLLLTFDSTQEDWVGTFTTANTRIGLNSLSLTAPLSTTTSATLSNISLDIGTGAQNDDVFRFGMNVSSANCNYVEYLFKENASNYVTARVNTPGAGYGVFSVARTALTTTGAPNLANITEVTVNLNSKATGSTTVDLDNARVDGSHDSVSGTVLVARQEIVSPLTKKRGTEQEIETTLTVFA